MKIQDIIQQTGLQKRTVYYYIKEQLISPKINPENGYFIFSEMDLKKLSIIAVLRSAGFSINSSL